MQNPTRIGGYSVESVSSTAPAHGSQPLPAARNQETAQGGPTTRKRQPAPVEVTRQWWWLGYEQRIPVHPDQWALYDPVVQYHLSASFDAMRAEGRHDGLVLDLGPFTDPPSPYQVWRGSPAEVVNKNEREMLGHLAIAGYTKDLWSLPAGQLPAVARQGRIVGGFYQVRREHVDWLEDLNKNLTDPRCPPYTHPEPPRRRVVILVEIERATCFYGDVNRFRTARLARLANTMNQQEAPKPENDTVPHGEAVFQWWWGNPNDPRAGFWKNYHTHVSKRLEQALVDNERFRDCAEAVPIDGVRYNLQRISKNKPFNYLDDNLAGNFREPFMPEDVLTVDHPVFDEQTRLTGNCFVQFHNGNPRRRRPVRRVRRGEAAGLIMKDGEPCSICFSDDGMLTGCEANHVICGSCLRHGLRAAVGDVTQTETLICGCLSVKDKVALQGLADKADQEFQEILTSQPAEGTAERQEFDMELAQVRRAFQCYGDFPSDVFRKKVDDWFDLVRRREVEHLFLACSHPGCDMDNWLLRTDFDSEYRARGECTWICKAGHRNSVLPTQQEINDINRNILLHPEHYTDRCGHDTKPLRRFRLCAQCVAAGLLTLAVHEEGCKQWPGYGSGHRHCFCFHCTRVWGRECNHGDRNCNDPGIQQVRRALDEEGCEVLQLGYIEAQAYIHWIGSSSSPCPPTCWPGSEQTLGATRQGQLGMEDKELLKRTMDEGTT